MENEIKIATMNEQRKEYEECCPVCLKEATEVPLLNFSPTCQHKACFECLQTWIRRRKDDHVSCFECRQDIALDFLVELGLNTTPQVATNDENPNGVSDDNVEVSLDPLTQDWLDQFKAKECPHCSIWITKDGGCRHMECSNCGGEFCWVCLSEDYESCERCDEEDCDSDEEDEEEEEEEAAAAAAELFAEQQEQEVGEGAPNEEARQVCQDEEATDTGTAAEPEQEAYEAETEESRSRANSAEELCEACKVGDIDNVRSFLARGPHLLERTWNGRTPLFYASSSGHLEIIRFLLAEGATDPGGLCYMSALTDLCRRAIRPHVNFNTDNDQNV